MHAGARLAQAVQLQGMGKHAVGQRGLLGPHAKPAGADHVAGAWFVADVPDHDRPDGRLVAINRGCNGVDQAVQRHAADGVRDVVICQRSGILRQHAGGCSAGLHTPSPSPRVRSAWRWRESREQAEPL